MLGPKHSISQQTLRNTRSWSSSSSDNDNDSNASFKSKNNEAGSSSSVNKELYEDEIILFAGTNVRLQQFCTFRKHDDFDSPPSKHNRIKVETLAKGELQVYKMLGKKAAFMRCGSFVHPILPKLRTWRTELNEFIIPQPIPGKYWRIEIPSCELNDEFMGSNLEQVFDETCFYRNQIPPPAPPTPPTPPISDEEVEDPYSSSASTLDRILDGFEPDDESVTIAPQHSQETELVGKVLPDEDEEKDEKEEEEENDQENKQNQHDYAPASTTSQSYMNHPLVPLATRNNIISSTFPLQFKPMEDDWLEVSGNQIPSQSNNNNNTNRYVSWASQVTTDLVSSSSNYLTDKMEKMTLYSASYVPKLSQTQHPQTQWDYTYAHGHQHPHSQITQVHSNTYNNHRILRRESFHSIDLPVDFYYQAKTVSGYVGWRLWTKLSPWARRT